MTDADQGSDEQSSSEEQALAEAAARVGDRWTLLIVHALLGAPRRFNDLAGSVKGIAPNILSQRLKQLEQHGVVVAKPYSQRPPRFVYELTAAGQELAGALRLLAQWGAAGRGSEPLRHTLCGTAVEARWYCPACEQVVDDVDGAAGSATSDEVRWL